MPRRVSALFALTIVVVYWFVADREVAGTLLLGVMVVALAFAATYAITAERYAKPEGDDPDPDDSKWVGNDLGVYTTRSAWPILVALCAAGTMLGSLWSPLVPALGVIALILCLWRLGAESARQP
ncbi:MAG TPA: cytochrome c oxidase subunit 4 [Candidatus Aquilonibacter sp.]